MHDVDVVTNDACSKSKQIDLMHNNWILWWERNVAKASRCSYALSHSFSWKREEKNTNPNVSYSWAAHTSSGFKGDIQTKEDKVENKWKKKIVEDTEFHVYFHLNGKKNTLHVQVSVATVQCRRQHRQQRQQQQQLNPCAARSQHT